MNLDLSDSRRYQEHPRHIIIFSIDLGKQQDHTAWAMCEVKPQSRMGSRGKRYLVQTLTVRDLVRMPLGVPYNQIQRRIHNEFWNPAWWMVGKTTGKPMPPQIVIDSGGPGIPVVDNLVHNLDLKRHIISYALTRGSAQPKFPSKNRFTVPRSLVFQLLYAAFTDERVGIDPRLDHAETLAHELKNLKVERTEETGIERVVHREGQHDDLSIAVGAANYVANLSTRGRRAKIVNANSLEEIDPRTGTFRRQGQALRSKRLEELARGAGLGVGGPGLARKW
jgi:hypothetical protein